MYHRYIIVLQRYHNLNFIAVANNISFLFVSLSLSLSLPSSVTLMYPSILSTGELYHNEPNPDNVATNNSSDRGSNNSGTNSNHGDIGGGAVGRRRQNRTNFRKNNDKKSKNKNNNVKVEVDHEEGEEGVVALEQPPGP